MKTLKTVLKYGHQFRLTNFNKWLLWDKESFKWNVYKDEDDSHDGIATLLISTRNLSEAINKLTE
jgi:hypothetical protein